MIGGWAIRPTLKRGNLQAISVGLRCERSASCKVVAVSAQRRHPLVRFLCCNGQVKSGKPTVRQVYALAAALCERAGEEFPETRDAASELIERLRIENGHPAPRLEDAPLRPRATHRRRGRRSDERDASRVAAELSREL